MEVVFLLPLLSYYIIREFGLHYEELMAETLLTWRSLVLYGLGLDHYHILHSSLVTRLQQEKHPLVSSALICLLSAFLSAAADLPVKSKSVRFRLVNFMIA